MPEYWLYWSGLNVDNRQTDAAKVSEDMSKFAKDGSEPIQMTSSYLPNYEHIIEFLVLFRRQLPARPDETEV